VPGHGPVGDLRGALADEDHVGELPACVVGPTPDDAIRQLMPLIDRGVTLVTILVPSRSSATLGEEPS
jgi:hypothetical protein